MIISLVTICFLPLFSTASVFVRLAGEENRMSSYALMVLEYLRAYPGEIREDMNIGDIDEEDIKNVPAGLEASLDVRYWGGESLYMVKVTVKNSLFPRQKVEMASIIAKH